MSAENRTSDHLSDRASGHISDRPPGRTSGRERLLTVVTWAVLLLGLWLWGREITEAPYRAGRPATDDVAAAGRPSDTPLPPALDPLPAAGAPRRLVIPALGVAAPVEARGLDADGAVDPPPYDRADTVGWYGGGAEPGAGGTAVLVGHVDTDNRPAVFHGLDAVLPGEQVLVELADGTVAEFTVEDVRLVRRDAFDARKVYGTRQRERAELRLVTCGGGYDRAARAYTANVVVSAYLTGTDRAA